MASSNYVDPVFAACDAAFDNGRGNVSLNAVLATATGVSFGLVGARGRSLLQDKFAWHVIMTGAPATIQVDIEGTLDGTVWFQLDTYTTTSNTLRFIVDKPVLGIRAKLVVLTGGTAPTVTVVIA